MILTRYNLHFTYVDTTNPDKVREAIKPETKMLWVETPTNPLLKVTDLEAMAKIAKERDLLYGVSTQSIFVSGLMASRTLSGLVVST